MFGYQTESYISHLLTLLFAKVVEPAPLPRSNLLPSLPTCVLASHFPSTTFIFLSHQKTQTHRLARTPSRRFPLRRTRTNQTGFLLPLFFFHYLFHLSFLKTHLTPLFLESPFHAFPSSECKSSSGACEHRSGVE